MAKFCGYCGGELDQRTGLCPVCDREKIIQTDPVPVSQGKPGKIKWAAVALLLAALVLVSVYASTFLKERPDPGKKIKKGEIVLTESPATTPTVLQTKPLSPEEFLADVPEGPIKEKLRKKLADQDVVPDRILASYIAAENSYDSLTPIIGELDKTMLVDFNIGDFDGDGQDELITYSIRLSSSGRVELSYEVYEANDGSGYPSRSFKTNFGYPGENVRFAFYVEDHYMVYTRESDYCSNYEASGHCASIHLSSLRGVNTNSFSAKQDCLSKDYRIYEVSENEHSFLIYCSDGRTGSFDTSRAVKTEQEACEYLEDFIREYLPGFNQKLSVFDWDYRWDSDFFYGKMQHESCFVFSLENTISRVNNSEEVTGIIDITLERSSHSD